LLDQGGRHSWFLGVQGLPCCALRITLAVMVMPGSQGLFTIRYPLRLLGVGGDLIRSANISRRVSMGLPPFVPSTITAYAKKH
jgi:hypothetical protein